MHSAVLPLCPTLLTPVAVCLALAGAACAQSDPAAIGEESFKVLAAFYDYDPEIPLEARVVDLQETATSVRRRVVFRSARGFLVPGYLELPKVGEPPYPCVLLLHGWSGSKDNWWEDGNYISGGEARKALLAKGYAVFALDAQGHGDRIAENDYQVVNLYNEPGAPPRKNYFTLREVIVQTVVDCRRAVDYLATRSDIDIGRTGVFGYSLGGFETLALTAIEPRVKASVACAVPISFSEDVVLTAANYARGVRNRALCLLMGKRDGVNGEARARELYRLVEGPSTRLVLYDSGHQFPVEYVGDAAAFIAEHL
jgi:pimeloyl-ACP methyl ester carboxylesterase